MLKQLLIILIVISSFFPMNAKPTLSEKFMVGEWIYKNDNTTYLYNFKSDYNGWITNEPDNQLSYKYFTWKVVGSNLLIKMNSDSFDSVLNLLFGGYITNENEMEKISVRIIDSNTIVFDGHTYKRNNSNNKQSITTTNEIIGSTYKYYDKWFIHPVGFEKDIRTIDCGELLPYFVEKKFDWSVNKEGNSYFVDNVTLDVSESFKLHIYCKNRKIKCVSYDLIRLTKNRLYQLAKSYAEKFRNKGYVELPRVNENDLSSAEEDNYARFKVGDNGILTISVYDYPGNGELCLQCWF